jgi:hypothetical protein
MVIKILLPLLLAAHSLCAQQGVFTIRPALGLQTVLNKQLYNVYTKAFLKNNKLEEEIYYGIGLEYELRKQLILSLSYMNGNSGYSIKLTPKPCNIVYTGSYTIKHSRLLYFNNRRLLAGFQFPLHKPGMIKKGRLTASLKLGLGLDFKGSEDDQGGSFLIERTNLCGEVYYLDDSTVYRSNTSWILPFQINLDWYHKQKKRLQLSAFIHLGLSKNVIFDVDYVNVTLNNREKASFLSRGSGYGIVLSYPIKLYRVKR